MMNPDEMSDPERLKWMLFYCFVTGKTKVRIDDPEFIKWLNTPEEKRDGYVTKDCVRLKLFEAIKRD